MKYLLFSLFIFLISCDGKQQPSQKDVAKLYVNILIAEETYKADADSLQISLDSLYKTHNISEDKYLKELEGYRYNEDTWKEFFSIAEEYLDTLKAVDKRESK